MLRFFLETFIELLICTSISHFFKDEVSTNQRSLFDTISIYINYALLIQVGIFLIVVIWVSVFKARAITKKVKSERNDKFSGIIEQVQIFTEALTQSEIRSQVPDELLKNPFRSTAGLRESISPQIDLHKVKRQFINRHEQDQFKSEYSYFEVLYDSLVMHKTGSRFY